MNVLAADTLIETHTSGPGGGVVAAVPAVQVGELVVYPLPVIRHGASRAGPTELVLDLTRWQISLPGGLAVPLECRSAQAATHAAQAFRRDAETGAISSYSPAALARWATHWCAHRRDAIPLAKAGSR